MKLFTVATLVTLAAAAPSIAPTPKVNVKLEMQENSKVKATVSNPTGESIKILKTGSILDSAPVQKASVSNEGSKVAFEGIRVFMGPQAEESNFQVIPAGESVEVTFDIAEMYNLSNGGSFDVQSNGQLSYAKSGDITKLGSIPFESNKLNTHVDGAAAAASFSSFHQMMKRETIQSDCTGSKLSAVQTASKNIRDIATKAAEGARSGPAKKMTEYFESASQQTRNVVAGAFDKMAKLYSTSGGKPDVYCTDRASNCQGGVVAYTLPSQNYIVYCPTWFSSYQPLDRACRKVDQAHIAVHESTHLSLVKGTSDYNTYGYDNSIRLPASQNLNHADTYAYFAHDTLSGC